MDKSQFKLDSFLNNQQEAFHVARTTINSRDDLQLHHHGFAEVFWIKEGSGIHVVNNGEYPVKKGHLCMIRPMDKHTFRLDKQKESLVITNIAFYKDSLQSFRERYFADSKQYFWSQAKLPFSIELNSKQLNELSAITDRLIGQPRDFREQSHIPHWLAYALENYNTPEKFANGIQGFVGLTNRSVDHVNRVLQQHLKQTLTETVIKARLQYACQQLVMTNSSIKSICFDCGFESLSYFYRIFSKHVGQTQQGIQLFLCQTGAD